MALVGHSFGIYLATECARRLQINSRQDSRSYNRTASHIFSLGGIAKEQLELHELYNVPGVEGVSQEELARLIQAFTASMEGDKPEGLLSESFDTFKYVVEGM